MDFMTWRERQDPDTIPFRPGAGYTEGFGLRRYDTASPAHLGPDREGQPDHILMPFDEGEASWRRLPDGHPWGSFLRIAPTDGFPAELHVAHTLPTDTPHAQSWSAQYVRGDRLPVRAADIGTATGPHTHTELLVAFDTETIAQLRDASSVEIIKDKAINVRHLSKHCDDHGLNFDTVHARLTKQIETWEITDMTDIYCIRLSVPRYRRPRWGKGDTLHVDSRWALKI